MLPGVQDGVTPMVTGTVVLVVRGRGVVIRGVVTLGVGMVGVVTGGCDPPPCPVQPETRARMIARVMRIARGNTGRTMFSPQIIYPPQIISCLCQSPPESRYSSERMKPERHRLGRKEGKVLRRI